MELQLGKQEHRMYTRVFDRTEEETCSVDAVVPDALGDLSALVVTEGTFCLWNLAFSDKSAQIEGCIAADVVYAEENGALRSFPVELPVKVHMSGETLAEDVRPWLRCTLAALDARAVNSRKVRVTARLSLCLRAYRETELTLTERIESDSGAVFTHSEPLCVHVPLAVEEQTFTATQMHRFSAGQPETDRLLCHTESVLFDEVRIADGRAVVQGRVRASVSYLQQGQSCPVVETFETPFSQLLDCPADAEPCMVQASVSLTAAYLNVSTAADGATLETEYHLVAQTVCFGELTAECVTDAYCNTAQLQLEWETGVIACDAAALTVRAQRAELCGAASDGCDVLVRLLVTDAEQHVSCLEKRLHLQFETGGTRAELLYALPEAPAVTATADGFQLRAAVTADVARFCPSEFRQVTGVTVQERSTPYAAVPSLTIVRWNGEDLWQLSKRYCSSERCIRETNGLLDNDVPVELPQYLLIPKTEA